MSLAYIGKLDNGSRSGTVINIGGSVPTFADLPSAGSHLGEIYYVQTSTGVWPINFKAKGYYKSDGSAWFPWELDAEGLAALSNHAANTITHGTSSSIVGVTDSQELKNKTIDYNQNTILNLPNPPASLNINIQRKPVELPNGSRVTFTIPYSHVVRIDCLEVKLNGVSYNPDNIVLNLTRTQFTITNDHVPKTRDVLTITYDKE